MNRINYLDLKPYGQFRVKGKGALKCVRYTKYSKESGLYLR